MTAVLTTTTGRRISRPRRSDIEKVVAAMPRDSAVVVSDAERPDWYAQAWLLPSGVHQVEVRVGPPTRHLRSFRSQQDAVVDLLDGWRRGRLPDLTDWDDITAMVTEQ